MSFGDKAYGLLYAYLAGMPVPRSVVVSRAFPPCSFGRPTGTGEVWLRTCPKVSTPGHYTTVRGWTDPFALLTREDPSCDVASVISQDHVEAHYAGAAMTAADGTEIVEGVERSADDFMMGERGSSRLPDQIAADVRSFLWEVSSRFGPAHIEWAHDGAQVWLLQLRQIAPVSTATTIVPGEPARFRPFEVELGLEALRHEIEIARACGEGILVIGDVGVTSHFGDVLREASIPSKLDLARREGEPDTAVASS